MADKVKISFTLWERRNLYELLSNQNIGRAPLGKVQDMMDARAKLDPSELNTEDEDTSYELTFSKSQFDHIYKLATNEQIPWPISEQSVNLYNKLEEAKNDSKK